MESNHLFTDEEWQYLQQKAPRYLMYQKTIRKNLWAVGDIDDCVQLLLLKACSLRKGDLEKRFTLYETLCYATWQISVTLRKIAKEKKRRFRRYKKEFVESASRYQPKSDEWYEEFDVALEQSIQAAGLKGEWVDLLKAYYGLGESSPKTSLEIAEKLGVTHQCVLQKLQKIYERLREVENVDRLRCLVERRIAMSDKEREFISLYWSERITGWWVQNASRVFWARAYTMKDPEDRKQMARHFIACCPDDQSSSMDLAKRILSDAHS